MKAVELAVAPQLRHLVSAVKPLFTLFVDKRVRA